MRHLLACFLICAASAAHANSPVQITPLGKKILAQSVAWKKGQWTERATYAKPARCAVNLTRVYKDVALPHYAGDSVYNFLRIAKKAVQDAGRGMYVPLPRNNRAGISQAIEKIYGGRIPVGTIIAGCITPSCAMGGPNEHIGIIGDADAKGNIWVWHNNWLRQGVDRAKYGNYMVSMRNMNAGYPREWMQTPWLNVKLDDRGVADTRTLLPEIDDLDPNQYYVTLVVLPELAAEVEAARAAAANAAN